MALPGGEVRANMNADDQIVDGFGERPLRHVREDSAQMPIEWTKCFRCTEAITKHKSIVGPGGHMCVACFTELKLQRDAFRGGACAILCTGPSVRQYDLSKITVPTIGVNWSYLGAVTKRGKWTEERAGFQADIHVLSNIIFIRTHGHEFDKLTPKAKFRFSPKRVAGAFQPHTILSYAGWKAYTSGVKVPPIPKGYDIYNHGWVFAGGGPCALQVAVSFGFKEIVFVGLDLDTGSTCHFYEDNPDMSERSGYTRAKLDRAWVIQAAYFRAVAPSLDELGVRVTNLGASNIFERGDWGEIT
jgi:hypothetical protein